jgi:hypothetical protein
MRGFVSTIAALVLFSTTSPIIAQTIKGSGNDNCGDWLAYRQSVGTQQATSREVMLLSMEKSWIDGFVSAINATQHFGSMDLLNARPGEGMYVWVDNYCRSKPLSSILDASIALVSELRSKARGK